MLPHFSYDFLAYQKKEKRRKRLTKVVSCLTRDKNESIDSKLPAFWLVSLTTLSTGKVIFMDEFISTGFRSTRYVKRWFLIRFALDLDYVTGLDDLWCDSIMPFSLYGRSNDIFFEKVHLFEYWLNFCYIMVKLN